MQGRQLIGRTVHHDDNTLARHMAVSDVYIMRLVVTHARSCEEQGSCIPTCRSGKPRQYSARLAPMMAYNTFVWSPALSHASLASPQILVSGGSWFEFKTVLESCCNQCLLRRSLEVILSRYRAYAAAPRNAAPEAAVQKSTGLTSEGLWVMGLFSGVHINVCINSGRFR